MTTPTPAQRPILGSGRGRVVALTTAMASVLPLIVLNRYADEHLSHWFAVDMDTSQLAFWRAVTVTAQPVTWFVVAIVVFGAAAAYNWSNTARWMGVLVFAVTWASLADIAVAGHPSGAATSGAVAMLLCLWLLRWWPAWLALGVIGCVAEGVVERATGTQIVLGTLLGAFGTLLVEYAWHHVAPHALPRRNAPVRS